MRALAAAVLLLLLALSCSGVFRRFLPTSYSSPFVEVEIAAAAEGPSWEDASSEEPGVDDDGEENVGKVSKHRDDGGPGEEEQARELSNEVPSCDFSVGHWKLDSYRKPLYSKYCLFQRNAWNCGKNKKPGMERISQWRWVPKHCSLPGIEPYSFLSTVRNMKLAFVGDSLNENLMISLLCILSTADGKAKRWKRRRAWRGAFFPGFNVTVAYHRAVLLSDYQKWMAGDPGGPLEKLGFKTGYRVDIDRPAADWLYAIDFYDVFVFNTGHWWEQAKFPKEMPLLFFKGGKPVLPPLGLREGLAAVLESTMQYIERKVPTTVLKVWRLQTPRHFQGGDWNQNGSCTSSLLLNSTQVEALFEPANGGVNREEREVNHLIKHAMQGITSMKLLDVALMSEFRADAHPSIWLGSKDAQTVWGQDCLHWCLPGLPDIWVDMLATMIMQHLKAKVGSSSLEK